MYEITCKLSPKLARAPGKLAEHGDVTCGERARRDCSGAYAAVSRDVLAKGTAVDLHQAVFKPGMSAATQIGHVGVTIACTGADSFDPITLSTFAAGFWEGLCELSLEWGYEVR